MRLAAASGLGVCAVLLTLAACTRDGAMALDAGGTAWADSSAMCAADHFQLLVGEYGTEIDTASLPQPMRVISYEQPLEADPDRARMTLVTADDGRVAQVVCN